MGIAREYADAVLRRSRVPMEPVDHETDWADQPRTGKFYRGVPRFPLPAGDLGEPGDFDGARTPAAPMDLASLGALLRDTFGVHARRLAVHANASVESLPEYASAAWARGVASGGGLYPATVYWVCGPSGPLTPGVYHYNARHHAMERLLAGDVSGPVAELCGAPESDQFLLVGAKFWQNSFKYASFSYHVITMDSGALTSAWEAWGREHGLKLAPNIWFDEPGLGRILGLDPVEEGLFAVVPLPASDSSGAAGVSQGNRSTDAAVRFADEERSRSVQTFDTVRRVHAATLAATSEPAEALAIAPEPLADADVVVCLPPPSPTGVDLPTALKARRSSFGRFTSAEPTTAAELSTLLEAAHRATALYGGEPLGRLYVYVNHITSVDAGSYRYEPRDHTLHQIAAGDQSAFLQRAYYLSNYNLHEAAAVIVPAVRVPALLDAMGDRGLRMSGGVVGAAAQTLYTTCAALDLGCGVALGFDGVGYVESLGLAATGEYPQLIMLVGREHGDRADFRFDLTGMPR